MNSSFESERTTAPRRGRTVTSPCEASRPSASRIGPRLTPSCSDRATSVSSVPGSRAPERICSRSRSCTRSQRVRFSSGAGRLSACSDGNCIGSSTGLRWRRLRVVFCELLTVCKPSLAGGLGGKQAAPDRTTGTKGDSRMHMHRRGARIVLALAALCLLAAGTAYAAKEMTQAKVTKVGFASPAKASDYGWNQQGYKGAVSAAKTGKAKFQAVTNIGYDKTEVVLRQLINGGAKFIVAHASGYDTIATRLAKQYKVPMMTYDVPTNLTKGLVSYITTSSQEGAYLAGILAAKTTKTHKVGIVISAADDNWYKMSGGFASGFRSVDKSSKIFFATISPTGYDDAQGGNRVARSVIAQGADVLFTMGDNASFGYLQAVESAKVGHKVWMIGDIGNMTPIDKKHVFLSSVLWNFAGVFNRAIKDINGGTYGTHGYNLDLKNGGISLLKSKYIPAKVWTEIVKAQAKIKAGKIKIPVAHNAAAVRRIIR